MVLAVPPTHVCARGKGARGIVGDALWRMRLGCGTVRSTLHAWRQQHIQACADLHVVYAYTVVEIGTGQHVASVATAIVDRRLPQQGTSNDRADGPMSRAWDERSVAG
eukprot:352749-Chlamydomonas_euryale.AAC.11